MSSDFSTRKANELVSLVRFYEQDHGPDGWPAVQMKLLTELANEIERLILFVKTPKYHG